MEQLISCEACRHGAASHEAGGCTVPRCGCRRQPSLIVEEALQQAREEIRAEWSVRG